MTLYSEVAQISRDAWAARAAARSASAAASRAARAAARSVSPAASRAARSAASRSARSAAVFASRAARSSAAAAAEAARGAYYIRCCDFHKEEEERRRIRNGTEPVLTHVPGVDVTDKDLDNDEALWALYEQWCKAYKKVRDHSDMVRRFNIFKDSAESVVSNNKAHEGIPEKHLCLGAYADGFDAKDIAERKAEIEAAGCSHLLSIIDSISPPTPLINSSP